MDFLYYPDPEHDVPIDDPDSERDWRNVDLSMSVCVQRGVAYLLATHPRAMLRINLARLAMNDCTMCALGQIFGDYADSPEYLKHDGAWLVAHGFTLDPCRVWSPEREWEDLTVEWTNQLSEVGVLW